MTGKYLYGIIRKTKNTSEVAEWTPRRWRGKPRLSTVNFDSLSAVISDAKFKDYSSLPKKEAIKELTSHQQTIERIMQNFGTVLPVKFGTILKHKSEISLFLEKNHPLLEETLRKMEDKIELDLVCFWNKQKAAQLAYQESKKIRDYYTSEVARRDSSDGGIENKITLGKLVAQHLVTKKKKLSTQILKVLKKEVVGSCNHALADINMVFNHAFLIEKNNEERFGKALDKLNCKFADLVNFRLVGPLPPYSFATVVVETLSKKEIDSAKKILGLDEPLGKEKIKHAYNKLAMWFHPDKGGDPLAFELATKAYKLLTKYVSYQGLLGVYLHKWEDQDEL